MRIEYNTMKSFETLIGAAIVVAHCYVHTGYKCIDASSVERGVCG